MTPESPTLIAFTPEPHFETALREFVPQSWMQQATTLVFGPSFNRGPDCVMDGHRINRFIGSLSPSRSTGGTRIYAGFGEDAELALLAASQDPDSAALLVEPVRPPQRSPQQELSNTTGEIIVILSREELWPSTQPVGLAGLQLATEIAPKSRLHVCATAGEVMSTVQDVLRAALGGATAPPIGGLS